MDDLGSSGRRGRSCTDHVDAIDIRELARRGLLLADDEAARYYVQRAHARSPATCRRIADRVQIDYEQEEWQGRARRVCVDVALDRTSCHFGGERSWWRCPRCRARVAVLYVGSELACRRCCGLAYRSERETEEDRAGRRVNQIRRRLGWKAGIANGRGPRPKGMHETTFARLCEEHEREGLKSLLMGIRRISILRARLGL